MLEPITLITPVNNMDDYKKNVAGSITVDQHITIEDGESAAKAINEGIDKADNDLCVICHQDIIFPPLWEYTMQGAIDGLKFGVCGLWGITLKGELAGKVIEPRGRWLMGDLPAKAQNVDELLMIVRKSSGLRFDEDLDGWHFYGADICLQAIEQGMTNYIIDAHVEHLSMGNNESDAFALCRKQFEDKWKDKSPIKEFQTVNSRGPMW